jgi:hypothetical protein
LSVFVHRFVAGSFPFVGPLAWVAEDGLPPLATGDFHRPEHLSSWKTLLRCEKDTDAVLDCLRSRSRVYLTPFAAGDRLAVPVAA